MSELIERYIYDVTRRLPETERGEVKRELEASITDMLPDNPGEQDIVDVLIKLGAPNKLAEQYRQKPRYLISPAMYDSYITALKTVLCIVAPICALVGLFAELFSVSDPVSVGKLIGNAIGLAVEGALQAALWVTVGFVIADRTGAKNEHTWTVKDLPRMPDQDGVKISRVESIVGMTLTVLFASIIIMMIVRGEWFFVLVRGAEIINPFTQAALYRSIPFILLTSVLSLAVLGMKLYWARWNIPLCVVNAVYNLIWVGVVIYMLHWPDLFSGEFLAFAERTFTADFDILKYITTGGTVSIFSAIMILVAVADTAVAGWYTWKGIRKTN